MLNFVYLRSSSLHFLHFWLDSCIANKGENFELEMTCWMHLEGFQAVSSHFWALVCTGLTGQSAGSVHLLATGLTGGGDRTDRSELSCCRCSVLFKWLHAFVLGELHWFRGSLHVCRGSSLWFFEFCFGGLRSLLELCFVSDVSSRFPCLRGPRLVLFK
jgi:hypothetical protein